MDNRQEDIQKNIINENENQDPFKFKMDDISDENFIFTRKEECDKFLKGVNDVLNNYIKAKQKFCEELKKIQTQLNSLTEAKSTTLKSTSIYKFTEMMSCYLNDFISNSTLGKVEMLPELLKNFNQKILEVKKEDKNNTIQSEYNSFFNGQIDKIKKYIKKNCL